MSGWSNSDTNLLKETAFRMPQLKGFDDCLEKTNEGEIRLSSKIEIAIFFNILLTFLNYIVLLILKNRFIERVKLGSDASYGNFVFQVVVGDRL